MKRLVVLAFTEKDFLSWERHDQEQWVKDHPDSRFAELLGKGKKPSGVTLVPKAKKTVKTLKEKMADKEKAFKEFLKTKSPQDAKVLAQARKDGVKIPGAWTEIEYYGPNPKDGVYARGRAANGKRQSCEDPKHREKKIKEKHKRIQKNLEPKFDATVKKLRADAQDSSKVEAQVLYLISQMAFRIGGDDDNKAKVKAYGATTLEGRHVSIKGNEVTFDFIGKKNVRQLHTTTDPIILSMMKARKKVKPDEPLFKTNDDKVRAVWAEYGGEKVHDMRSLIATRIARAELAKRKGNIPTGEKGYKKMVNEIAEVAARKLGNDPAESLNTYIDRSIFAYPKGKKK